MEEVFDEAYERYMVKKEGSSRKRKRARLANAEKLEDGDGEEEEMSFDYYLDKDELNPLVVALGDEEEAQTKEDVSNHWFSQNIFVEAVEEGDLGTEKQSKTLSKPYRKSSKQTEEDDFEIVPTPETDSDSSSDDDDEANTNKAEILACAKKMQRKKQRRDA